MNQTLTKAPRAVDVAIDAGADALSTASVEGLREVYLNTAAQGVTANTPGSTGRSHDAYKLAKRMRERVDQVLYFTLDFATELTNNPAEQAVFTALRDAFLGDPWSIPTPA